MIPPPPANPSLSPSVSLIIVTYNAGHLIRKALDSVRDQTYLARRLKTIVVDNASTDDTAAIIRRDYPWVTLTQSATNTGFAGGNNIGMRMAPADYFALVNQDVVLDSDWLQTLVAVMAADRSLGVAGSKVFYAEGRLLQHAGAMFRANALTYHIGDGEPDTGQYDLLREVDYVLGAAMLIRASVAAEVGYLSEAYFPAYFEEAEFCTRTRKAGYRVVYVPGAIAYHDETHSGSGRLTLKYVRRYHRHRYLYALRNLSTPDERASFIQAERAWRKTSARGLRVWLLLTYCKLANWRLLKSNRWLLRTL